MHAGMQADVMFLSPPWGGVAYFQKDMAFEVTGDCFGLGADRDLQSLLQTGQQCLRDGHGCLVAYLPRHTHLQQVCSRLVPDLYMRLSCSCYCTKLSCWQTAQHLQCCSHRLAVTRHALGACVCQSGPCEAGLYAICLLYSRGLLCRSLLPYLMVLSGSWSAICSTASTRLSQCTSGFDIILTSA